MRIARFLVNDAVKTGIVQGEKAVIEGEEYLLRDLRFLPPSAPRKIVCVGLNYVDHAKELGMKLPDEPIIFLKPSSALNSHDGVILLPSQSKRVEYEAELAFVIEKRCKNVKKEDALDYILGLTCFNDVTARDLQARDGQWTRAKGFDTFAPVGPWITTRDEFSDLEDLNLGIKLLKNNRVMQDSNTINLIFNIPYLVEFVSGVMTLETGDVVSTGAPPGVGRIKGGDVLEVSIEGVGVLRNRVEAA